MSPEPATGEINSDPRLMDPEGGDYTLAFDSPCINAGNPDPLYADPDGSRNDMGAFFYDSPTSVGEFASGQATWSRVKVMFR